MLSRLLALATMAVIAQAAEVAGPSGLYVVSVSFSDYGALFYYRVVDVM